MVENRKEKIDRKRSKSKKTVFRFLFYSLFSILYLLVLSVDAHAAAVYLKNGRVIQGKIVEANEQFIVIESGKDENAVRTTVYFEDINKIEGEKAYLENVRLIPFNLFKTGIKKPWEDRSSFAEFQAPVKGSFEHIKELLSEDKLAKSKAAAEREILVPQEPLDEPVAIDRPVVGDGSISGTVTLPKIMAKRGDLYVYLMEDLGGGQFYTGKTMHYQKIDKDSITFWRVSYKIEHVPIGAYKVFAQWDIAAPPIQEKVSSSGKVLSYLGLKGDYKGSIDKTLILALDQEKENVDFYCTAYVEADEFFFVLGKKPDFQILDLYYRRLPKEDGIFILRIKNNTYVSIDLLVFDVFINDMKVTDVPFELNELGPLEEKEYDVTSTYEAYQGLLGDEGVEAGPRRLLKFKFVWPVTGEVLIEKTVFVPA